MIVAEQKSLNEIKAMLRGCKKVLAVGCGTCVTVCFSGGRQEVGILSASVRMSTELDGEAIAVDETMVQRQCEEEFIAPLQEEVGDYDAILSLGCGVGVQSLAQEFPGTYVIPARRSAARAAAIACCTSLAASARSAVAPSSCSTVPVADHRTESARSTRKPIAPGTPSLKNSSSWVCWRK
jgi:ferredoxin